MDRQNEPAPARTRPGGRSARVRASVLSATLAALADVGYESLSMEDIAARAGVHKTTVYRRWTSKADLVGDAMLDRSQQQVPIPDTGSLAGDLAALGRAVATSLNSAAGAHAAKTLVAAATTSPAIARQAEAFWAERIRHAGTIVERATARGDVSAETDANIVIETLLGPLWFRLLLTREPLDDSLVDRIATLVATGVTPRPDSH